MKKIATLGPSGTFSDAATSRFAETLGEPFEVEHLLSIGGVARSVGNTCDLAVLPVENLSEGFIPLVLDLLVEVDLVIVGEVLLPIRFSCVSTSKDLAETNHLFVQFVARGQCSEFIESLGDLRIETTESNIESLDRVRAATGKIAAIVPHGSFNPHDFPHVVEDVNDYENNQTRFLVLSNRDEPTWQTGEGDYKTSIIVLDDDDHPGLLGEILDSFSKRKINLTSIISRPTRRKFGKYHFFIDLDGRAQDPTVSDALGEIHKLNKVKILGSYLKDRSA